MCHSRKIFVCASGVNSRIDWIMLTHDTAQHADVALASGSLESTDKIILFDDLNEGE